MRPHLAVLATLLLAAPGAAGDLPFLPEDGAIWIEYAPPFLWLPGPREFENGEEEWRDSQARLRPEIEGPSDDLIHRAIRAAYGRRVRIELSITLAGETLDVRGVVPEGAMLHEDARVERSWPAALDLDGKYGKPASVSGRVGTAVDAAASRTSGDAWTLRLAIRASRVVAEHRFEGDVPTLVAPELEFASLLADLPIRPGERGRLRADGPGGEGSLVIGYEVHLEDDPAPPPGARVYPLHALRAIAAAPFPPSPGLRPSEVDVEEPEIEEPAVPGAWRAAAGEAVRLVHVRPDVVVAVGDESALRGLDRVVEVWWKSRGPEVTLLRTRGENERTEIPLAGGGRTTLVQGRVRPVAVDVRTSIVQSIALAGVEPGWLFTGRRLVVVASPAGSVRVEEAIGQVGTITRETAEVAVDDQDGARRLRVPRDRFAVAVTQAGGSYRPGEPREETEDGRPTVTEIRPGRSPR